MPKNISEVLDSKETKLKDKFQKLLKGNNSGRGKEKSNRNAHRVEDRYEKAVVNLSNVEFTNRELNFLGKGIKFNLDEGLNEIDVKRFVAEVNVAIDGVGNDMRDDIRHKLLEKCEFKLGEKKENKNGKLTKLKVRIKKKLKDNNLVATKADKGNSIVIMNENEYITKTMKFIEDNEYKSLKNNPTSRIQAKTKLALKRIENVMDSNAKKKVVQMNPKAPRLKALAKIHKKDVPIRLIINGMSSPTYNVEKFLHNYLKTNYRFANHQAITNRKDLIDRLNSVKIEDGSFHIK